MLTRDSGGVSSAQCTASLLGRNRISIRGNSGLMKKGGADVKGSRLVKGDCGMIEGEEGPHRNSHTLDEMKLLLDASVLVREIYFADLIPYNFDILLRRNAIPYMGSVNENSCCKKTDVTTTTARS
ncbi:hypothetical protein EVAR_47759_1 [Eumeta japonica]|uniref:Uncharacterized protein n=1 Tax=Eumeta variegata TaxID=151549 RepID=A0A4C1XVR3_EUMVA|nr:hypothetical protein EVAR_47759_1 [Eumeta japonica]